MKELTFLNKSSNEIKEDLVSLAKKETGLKNISPTSPLNGFLETLKYVILNLNNLISQFLAQVSLDKATGMFLDVWGKLLGVSRKEPVPAAGNFTGWAYNQGTLSKGSWITIPGLDLRFKITESVNFTKDNKFNIPVEAEFTGSHYNVPPETEVKITKVIGGLSYIHIESGWLVTPGQDKEEDTGYRERIKDRWNARGEGAAPSKYEYYATMVTGVNGARVIRTPRGWGSADLILLLEDGINSQDVIDQVYDVLEDKRLMCRDLLVKLPSSYSLDINITYSGKVMEDEVTNKIREYIYSLSLGALLEIRDLYKAVEELPLSEVFISKPSNNIQAENNEQFTISSITVIQKED